MTLNHNPKLTSSEIAFLWTAYQQDSMLSKVLGYFQSKASDPDLLPIVEFAKSCSERHLLRLEQLFREEGIPVPHAFQDQDVERNAPRLFSDVFVFRYMQHMARMGLIGYGVNKSMAARKDIREYATNCLNEASELCERVIDTMLEKGIYIRSPVIPVSDRVEYVQKQSFLTGLWGDRRALTAIEISHLSGNIETNEIGRTMLLGFAQTTQDEKIRNYMERGWNIATKHAKVFRTRLTDEEIPAPSIWDSTVENTNVPVFTDRLMLQHVLLLIEAGIGNYGAAMAVSMRADLIADYVRLSAETAQYAEDGINLMIDRGWMEKPPQAVHRQELISG